MLKIRIQTNTDFTPKDKRGARVVGTSGQFGNGRQIRWYVGGRIYRKLAVTASNIELTESWLTA